MDFLGAIGFHLLLVLPCLLGESRAVHWTGPLQDEDVIHSCKNSNVTMSWELRVDSGETVTDTQWFFRGKSSNEIIAIFTHGQFMAYPAFSGRVSPTENAGITLTNLLPADSGNYTVQVNGHKASGQYFTLNSTATVLVSGEVMDHDGPLQLTQSVHPVVEGQSGQWAIQLLCGHFSFQDQPTYDVQWIFPDGQARNGSSGFKEGYFSLLLTSPVQGGTYACRVPRQHSCVNGQGVVLAEASLQLDTMEVRLELLEAMATTDHQMLKSEREQMERSLNRTAQRLRELEEKENETLSQLRTLTAENQDLQRQLNQLKETRETQKSVAFHVIHINFYQGGTTPVGFQDVLVNEGNGYDSSTGYFTAPFNGTYSFSAKSTPCCGSELELYLRTAPANGANNSSVVIDYTWVRSARDFSAYPMAAVHGVTPLQKGDKVWVSATGGPQSSAAAFSGTMVSC